MITPNSHTATLTGKPVPTLERRVLALAISILFHVALLCVGAAATAVAASSIPPTVLAREPLLVLAVALVMAHCGIGAIWWARSDWSPHAKTLVAVLTSAGLWLLLINLLDTTRQSGVAAAAWAACIVTQLLLTAVAVSALELTIHYQAAATRCRFNLLFLMIWTSIVALLLGVAGAAANRHGFKLADVADWSFFPQLQCVAAASAVLATAVHASVRLAPTSATKLMACFAAVLFVTMTAPALFLAIFGGKVGAPNADIVWLLGGQGAFLIATLLPLELSRTPYISK